MSVMIFFHEKINDDLEDLDTWSAPDAKESGAEDFNYFYDKLHLIVR